MVPAHDPRQISLIDHWEHLGSKRRRLLENSRAGLFHQEILTELPVAQLARAFHPDISRPAKELYTVLGVIPPQQRHDLTDLETVHHHCEGKTAGTDAPAEITLNPDELVNQDVKNNALGRQRPGNQTELTDKVRSYLRSRQCKPGIVAIFFQGKHFQNAG